MQDETIVPICVFGCKTDTTPRQQMPTWGELKTRLTQHTTRAVKDGPLWSPVVYAPETGRGNDGVESVSCFVVDFDGGVMPGPFREKWDGLEYVIYSSYSHTPDYPKWRTVFPLQRRVETASWKGVYRRLCHHLTGMQADPSCKDPARMFYLPACKGESTPFAECHTGAWLDPDQYPDLPVAVPIRATNGYTPLSSRSAPSGSGDYSTLNVVSWFQAHGLYGTDLGSGKHSVACPWEGEHTDHKPAPALDTDTVVWEGDDGLWPQFYCLHAHCDSRRIREVMELWGDADRYCSQEFGGATSYAFDPGAPAASPRPPPMSCAEARERVMGALAQLKETSKPLFEKETLYAFKLLETHDPAEWADAKKKLIDARIFRDVSRLFPRQVDKPADAAIEEDAPLPLRTAGSFLPDCPAPSLIIPQHYILSDRGIGHQSLDENGVPHTQFFAWAPVFLTGRTYNPSTGEESFRLTWRWTGSHWVSRIVDRGQALSTRGLVGLASLGFPVADDTAKTMVGYLHRLEAVNRAELPCAQVTHHLGWQGNPHEGAAFLIGRTLIQSNGDQLMAAPLDTESPETWANNRIFFHGLGEGEEQIVAAFSPRGTFEEWKRAVSVLAPYPKALLPFYAAFCPPLLALFGVSNFIVDLSNRTSTGKSSILHAAGSVWGNPDERTPYSVVQTWDATRVSTERISRIINGLPLIMDDTKKAKQATNVVADLIYAVASGRGRMRGKPGGLAETASWRTVMLSSGESPATSHTQDGGTRTRVLTLRGLPFGDQTADLGEMVGELNRNVFAHHGHAGPCYITYLIANRPLWDEWGRLYSSWREWYARNPAIPEASRLAEYAALITVAAQLAHTALDLSWKFDNPIATLWPDLIAEARDAAGDQRALEDLVSWCYANERGFYGRFFEMTTPPSRVYGRWDRDAWEWIAIFPNEVRTILEMSGYDANSILGAWRERGWIKCGDGKLTWPIRLPSGEMTRMTVIQRAAIESVQIAEEAEEPL